MSDDRAHTQTSTPDPGADGRACTHPPHQHDPGDPRGPSARTALSAMLGSITAVGLTLGITAPLFSVVLHRMGLDATLVGFNTSVGVGATLVAAPLVPWLLRWTGAVPLMVWGIVLSAGGLVVAGQLHAAWSLFAVRFAIGLGMALHWVISETWLNDVASDANRGLVAGLYSTLMGLGFAVGPAMLGFTGTEGVLPFVISAGAILLAGIPLLWVRGGTPAIGKPTGQTTRGVLGAAPVIMLASAVSGFVDTASLALLPVYGLGVGMDEATAVLQLTVATIGAVAMQLPIGWIGDRFGLRRTLLGCAVVKALTVALLPAALDIPWLLWPVLLIWGGAMVSFYTLALALVGARFRGDTLAKATSALVITYCLGSVIGPLALGGAMDWMGPNGFIVGMVLISGLLAAVVAVRLSAQRF